MSVQRPAKPAHILVAEDSPALSAELIQTLADEGFEVSDAHDVAGIFDRMSEFNVDLVTLDVGIAGDDGFALARQIRAVRNVPIVMITGRDSPADRLAGLEHGADDYITKPFLMREAVIRLRSVLARYGIAEGEDELYAAPAASGGALRFDGSVLDLRDRSVKRGGAEPARLTETEFQILKLLLAHPGRVFSRDEISVALWGRQWSPFDRSVDGHIARLRRKLEDGVSEAPLIRSVRSVGYVFVGACAGPRAQKEAASEGGLSVSGSGRLSR